MGGAIGIINHGLANAVNIDKALGGGFITSTITYADTTAALLGSLPYGAYVSQIRVLVTEAFNDGTSNVIDVGISGTANYFANDVDVSSIGVASVTEAKSGVVVSTSNDTDVYAKFVAGGAGASAGSAKIVITYNFI